MSMQLDEQNSTCLEGHVSTVMAAAGSKKEKKHLTLQEKDKVICKSEMNPKLPLRELRIVKDKI